MMDTAVAAGDARESTTASGTKPMTGVSRFVNLLKIHLNEGVSYLNLVIFFIAVSFGSIALLVYADSTIGFVLGSVPGAASGLEAGQIVFFGELVVFSTIWLAGIASDKIGRRWVFFLGTCFIAASFCAMPFATSPMEVLGFRLLFAPGAAAVSAMLMALICDYPRDDVHTRSRGKASGIMGALSGLGALFALFVLTRVASWIQPNAPANSTGGQVQFFVAAGVALLCGLVSLVGLAKNQSGLHYSHAPPSELIKSGLKGLSDPNVVLAYMASFIARGDSSIITLFLPLWTAQYGVVNHIDKTLAMNRGYEISGFIQTLALVSAPFLGILADKFSRTSVTLGCAVSSLVGFILLGILDNPYDWSWQLVASVVCLGIGEMGVLITGLSIMGLHAPTSTRGSISGFWSLCGSAGILSGSGIGGILFSHWIPGGPFVLFAGFNAILAVYALVLCIHERRRRPLDVVEAQPLIQ